MLAGISRVARFEYTRIVFRKRFLIVLLSPLLILLAMGLVTVIMVLSVFSNEPVGYVDLSGVIQPPASVERGRINTNVEILPFPNEVSGRAALAADDISALYVLGEDYPETGRVRLVAEKYPDEETQDDMEDFLQENLITSYSPDIAARLLQGSVVQTVFSDAEDVSESQAVEAGFLWKMFLPMVFSILFIVIIGVTSGYMLNAVMDEKTDRTVEILLTSVTPVQLMIGKIAGNLAIGLTQLLVWGGLPLLAVGVGAAYLPNFVGMGFDANLLWISAGLVAFGVLQFSGLLTILGATVADSREAQQVSGLVSLVFMLPFFFYSKLMFEPSGTVAVVLSMFPFTAPMSMPFRIAFSAVPAGQIGLAFVFSLLMTAGVLWLAGMAFHRGIMQYDRRLRLKELFVKKGRRNE
jgi:ABC-2 type transport system permease protein